VAVFAAADADQKFAARDGAGRLRVAAGGGARAGGGEERDGQKSESAHWVFLLTRMCPLPKIRVAKKLFREP
jgi:hypothetical protein